MQVTTLKLPLPLKERIVPLARAAGLTPHAWMVAALERQAALAEMRESFIADAEASAAEVDASGALCAAEDVHAYLPVARGAARAGHFARPDRLRRALSRDRACAPGRSACDSTPARGRILLSATTAAKG
jgi:predicted transcriptional regulator